MIIIMAFRPLDVTKRLAKLRNCPTEDSAAMVDCLRQLPVRDLVSTELEVQMFTNFPLTFTPVPDPWALEPVIPKPAWEAVRDGEFYDVRQYSLSTVIRRTQRGLLIF